MIDPPRFATRGLRHVFLRDIVLPASIGIYAHERAAKQRVRINVDMGVVEDSPASPGNAGLSRAGVGRAALGRVGGEAAVVRIRVEKLDVFDDLASVGVEIERQRSTCPPGSN